MQTLKPNFSSMVGLLVVTGNTFNQARVVQLKNDAETPADSCLQRLARLDPVSFTFEQDAVASSTQRLSHPVTNRQDGTREKISSMIKKQSSSPSEESAAGKQDDAGIQEDQLMPLVIAAIRELEFKMRQLESQIRRTEPLHSNPA